MNKNHELLKRIADPLEFDVSRETLHRDYYDLAVSRAVALLPTLMEFCLPFVAEEKYFVAMKGPEIENEIGISKRLFTQLSSQLVKVEQIQDLDEFEHNLVLIKKIKKTNSKYPRKFTQIKKDNQMYKDLLSKSRIYPNFLIKLILDWNVSRETFQSFKFFGLDTNSFASGEIYY